jgi:hypothetical protein
MAGESETRASRVADNERMIGKRERGASDHARPIRPWRATAQVSIRIPAEETRLGCASLARDSI